MLLFTEGFDAYASYTAMTTGTGQWSHISGTSWAIDATGGRFGGQCLRNTHNVSSNVWSPTLGDKNSNQVYDAYWIWAAWFKQTAKLTVNGDTFWSSVSTNGSFGTHAPSGNIQWNGGSTFLCQIADNQWHWIEWSGQFINSAAATLKVYVDGTAIALITANPGVAGNNSFMNMGGGNWGGAQYFVDDLILWNNTASTLTGDIVQANLPLGPKRIVSLRPTGAGSSTGWTPLSGSNWDNVDELYPDEDTTYVSTTAGTGTRDTYAFADLGVGDANPSWVLPKIRSKNNSAGTAGSIQAVTNQGGSIGLSEGSQIQNSYKQMFLPIFKDPATGTTWTSSGVNSAEFGFQIV